MSEVEGEEVAREERERKTRDNAVDTVGRCILVEYAGLE